MVVLSKLKSLRQLYKSKKSDVGVGLFLMGSFYLEIVITHTSDRLRFEVIDSYMNRLDTFVFFICYCKTRQKIRFLCFKKKKPMKLLILFLFCTSFTIHAQIQEETNNARSAREYQEALDATYSNADSTILSRKKLRRFKTLGFFPINLKYRVQADFKRTPAAVPFLIMTSSGREREYVSYGILSFALMGQNFDLPIYQNTKYVKEPNQKYGQSLFLPFTDYTSGVESYGAGRYIDVEISDIVNNKLIIDFNKAYNPYCAYTTGYSCPIPPEANDLKIRIEAGVKAYDKEH